VDPETRPRAGTAAYMRAYRRRRPEIVARDRARKRARMRALKRLAAEYPALYEAALAREIESLEHATA
jgi:hypothetical protein